MSYVETVKQRVQDVLEKGTLHWNASQFIRRAVIGTLIFAVGVAVFLFFLRGVWWSVAGLGFGVFLAAAFFSFLLTYSPYRKGQEIEAILPEALELIASNLKAGLTIRETFKLLVSDRYEPLSTEISRALAKESMGMPLREALLETVEHVQSRLYRKVVQSLVRGMEAGANLEDVAMALARNINDIRGIREKIRTSALSYTTFLTFASLVAAPFLFALSTFLVSTTNDLMQRASAGAGGEIPATFLSIGTALPDIGLLTTFFLTVLVITALSTSISIGIVNKGSALEGLKIAPVFVLFALAVYWVGGKLIQAFLGGLI